MKGQKMPSKKNKKVWFEKVDLYGSFDEVVLPKFSAIIEKGVEIDAQDEKGCSALMRVAALGKKECALKLIEKKANVNFQNPKNGMTPLMVAVLNKKKDMVELLLDKGAFVNAKDFIGFSAAMYAAENNDAEIFQILLNHKADLTAENNFGGNVWASSHPGSEIRRIIRCSAHRDLLKETKMRQRN